MFSRKRTRITQEYQDDPAAGNGSDAHLAKGRLEEGCLRYCIFHKRIRGSGV